MLRVSVLFVLLNASGCGEAASPSREDPPTTAATEPAVQSPAAPPAEAKTETLAPEPKREIIRRRCKPGYTPCHGGRECCNGQSEVCGEDHRCHPRE